MRIMGIDPGVRNCAFTILDDMTPIHWGGWFNFEDGDADYRVTHICHTLQLICDMWRVDAVVTEQFFAPKGKMASKMGLANYQRGAFDLMLNLACNHLHILVVHPGHLKKFATGKGNAPKQRTPKTGSRQTVIEGLEERLPVDLFDKLNDDFTNSVMNHVIESWGLAFMGRLLWRNQWKLIQDVRARETDVLRTMSKGATPWIAPRGSYIKIPRIPIRDQGSPTQPPPSESQ